MWDHRPVLRVSLPSLLTVALGGCLTDFPAGASYRCDTTGDCAGDNVCRRQGGERLCLPPDPRCPSGDCVDAALPRELKTDAAPEPQALVDAAAAPPAADAGPPPPEPCAEGEYVDDEFEAYGDAQRCSAICALFHQRCADAADDDPMWWCSPVPHDEIDCERPGRTLVCDCRR
jgi:hypothetical protein